MSDCLKSGVLFIDLSDHLAVFQFSKIKTNKDEKVKEKMSKRIMSEKNISKFKNSLDIKSWDNLYEDNNAELAYQKFMDVFSSCFEECFPVISFTKKHSDFNKPWFSPDLLKLLKKKNKLYKRYVNNPTPLNHSAYKAHRNTYIYAIRSRKQSFFSDKFSRCSNNIKSTWKVINQLLQRERATTQLPSVFQIDDEPINNPFDIAEKFNDFFVNIGSELSKNIPPCDGNPLDSI